MQIIYGSSNHSLAQKIAKITSYPTLKTVIKNFNDGELRVEIQGAIGAEVVIIQSTSHPANDHLMELLLLIDTTKRAGAKEIIAVIPYFGYSRQDRCTYKHGPISASLVARMIQTVGVTKIITLDLHSKQLEGLFNIPIINLDPASIFFHIYQDDPNIIIVSPDIGGIARARNFSSLFGKDLAIINKTRDSYNECSMSEVIGSVDNKKCIIVDDIVDTANTLCEASKLLKQNGALCVEAYITHAVLSNDSIHKIEQSQIDKVYVSDSIFHESLPKKFTIISTAEFISKAIIDVY